MATLSSLELASMRNGCERTIAVNYTKPEINAAAQAVETWLASNAASVSTAIDTATTPLVLTAAQKKKLFAEVVKLKYERDK